MKRIIISCIAICISLVACDNSQNAKLIIGNWDGVEWRINGQPSNLNATETHFTFTNNGTYTYYYAGNKDAGTYKVENEMLFTTPSNQQEMMVKIVRLTNDSLTFEMNRSGQAESLILVRNSSK